MNSHYLVIPAKAGIQNSIKTDQYRTYYLILHYNLIKPTHYLVIPAKAGIQKNMKTIHKYYVYILASQKNGTLYIGITNDLQRRVYEYKTGTIKGFTQKIWYFNTCLFRRASTSSASHRKRKQSQKMEESLEIKLN